MEISYYKKSYNSNIIISVDVAINEDNKETVVYINPTLTGDNYDYEEDIQAQTSDWLNSQIEDVKGQLAEVSFLTQKEKAEIIERVTNDLDFFAIYQEPNL